MAENEKVSILNLKDMTDTKELCQVAKNNLVTQGFVHHINSTLKK